MYQNNMNYSNEKKREQGVSTPCCITTVGVDSHSTPVLILIHSTPVLRNGSFINSLLVHGRVFWGRMGIVPYGRSWFY
jgi:hypothetical protein